MLNRQFRTLHDGAVAASVDLAHWDGVKIHIGRVFVYWPFVTFRAGKFWNITHAPTGKHVHAARVRGAAILLIKQLRTRADFEFVSMRGQKARRARKVFERLIPPLRKVA